MNEILERFVKWKGEHDEVFVLDEIHDFFLGHLTKIEMIKIINYIFESKRRGYIEEKYFAETLDVAPVYDGHTSVDVLKRIKSL